jgi:ribonuclease BN (tRNA processing enzyme)
MSTLEQQMTGLYSPVLEFAASAREYVHIDRHAFSRGDITIRPFPLHHPQGAWGYRIESDEGAVVHASDLEHGDATLDAVLREYAEGADVLIVDAQYTEEEYLSKRGWGHSTWLEATRVAQAAGVKQLVLFHHDPSHDDATMHGIVNRARRHFESTDAAREGTTITI